MPEREKINAHSFWFLCAAQHKAVVPLWSYAFCIAGPLAALLLVTVVVGIAPDSILKDPAAYLGTPIHIGFFSNVGILAWWTATAVCLTAATVLRGWGNPVWQALAAGGLLTAVLCVDDFMLLHERVFPTHLGVPEVVTLAVYGCATVLYLWHFRQFHHAMETPLLLAALALFGISVAVDLADIDDIWWGVLLEDGSKFIGIITWATYHVRSACGALLAARPRLSITYREGSYWDPG
jgi:hypothetical protein